jgi:hypothetical protein
LVNAADYDWINSGNVLVANVFFTSWGSFLGSILLACKWFHVSTKDTDWVFLGIFGAALFASIRIYYGKEGSTRFPCYQVGEYLGVITAIVATMMLSVQQKVLVNVRISAEVLLFVAWSFTTSCIAFGGNPPGASSIFLELWSAFFLCLDILITSISDMLRERREGASQNEEEVRREDEGRRTPQQDDQCMKHCNRIEILPQYSEVAEILPISRSLEENFK